MILKAKKDTSYTRKERIMPTGYTYKIQEGISFNEFIMSCARAFGACITLRDAPADKPIPEKFNPSTYHFEAIKKIEKELLEIKNLTLQECNARAKADYEQRIKSAREGIEKSLKIKEQYESMLVKVRAWQPPTPEHESLKKFMIDQIQISIEGDCSDEYYKKELDKAACFTPSEWRDKKIKTLTETLAYHKKENAEEISRTEGRNLWIKQLRESIN